MPSRAIAVVCHEILRKRAGARALNAALVISCTLLTLGTTFAAPPAEAHNITYNLDIPAQNLDSALQELALASQHKLLYKSQLVEGKTAPALKGEFTTEEAIAKLLSGTKLTYDVTPSAVVLIREQGAVPLAQERSEGSNQSADNEEGAQKNSFWDRFRVAEAPQGGSAPSASVAKGNGERASEQPLRLEEVVVTAQKREERLIDVPNSVSAVSGARLESLHVNSLADLANYIPGLTISNYGEATAQDIVIRGLSTGVNQAGPLVSTYVDDVPIGSSTSGARGSENGLDLNPFDIESVQVLKGPQGTLYGSNSLSGLIKYSLIKPNLTQFDGRVGTEIQHTNQSGGVDWLGRAAFNAPIVDGKLGARVSGFIQRSAGYIDNVGTGQNDANRFREGGFRTSLLWTPIESLSVQATALLQDVNAPDVTQVILAGTSGRPLYGYQKSSSYFPQSSDAHVRTYFVDVNWDLHFANLTSVSSWQRVNTFANIDYTVPYASYTHVPGALDMLGIETRLSKFAQEVRLASPDTQKLQWLAGIYYTHENAVENDNWPTYTSARVPLPDADNLIMAHQEIIYREAAAFADITYKMTNRLDFGGGFRYTNYKQAENSYSYGIFGVGIQPNRDPPADNVRTWSADVRYHLDDDRMVYARAATGYRPGTTNLPVAGVPPAIGPDKTTEYDIGLKGEFADRRLQLDTAIYYVKWRDIQVYGTCGIHGCEVNAGSATSRGLEFSSTYKVARGLNLIGTIAYTDAYLDQDTPEVNGKKGDQLPYSARWAGSLTADYKRPLNGNQALLLGASYRYRSTVYDQFPSAALPEPMAPQNIVDLYTGWGTSTVVIKAYVRNLTNNRSYLGVGFVNDASKPRYTPVLPRTVGISADWSF